MKATVKMLDGTEEQIEVDPVERNGFKLAPPTVIDSRWGMLKYVGKPQDAPALYAQV